MPIQKPDPVSIVLFVAMTLCAAGLMLWMYGWDQRSPSRTAQVGTLLMSVGGALFGMLAVALSFGLLLSSLAQAVQSNAVSPRHEQTPAR